MKNKKTLSLISILCAFIFIIGGALAFFSDNAILTESSKVGKVDIDVNGGLYHSNSLNNLNPGDNDPEIPDDYRPGTDHELSFEINNLGNKSVVYRTIIEVSATKSDNTPFTAEELRAIILSEKQNVAAATTQNTIASTDAGKQADINRLSATGYDDGKLVYIVGGTTVDGMTYVLNGTGENPETETNITSSNAVQTFDIGLDKDISAEVFEGASITFNVIVQAMQYRNTGDEEWNNIFEKSYNVEGAPETDNESYKEKDKTVFAIYSKDDMSLTFFNRKDVPEIGSIYKTYIDGELYEKTVTEIYTGFDTSNEVPWWDVFTHMHSVVVADKISPISTAHWFGKMSTTEYFDLRKLDTSKVTDMSAMFDSVSIKGPDVDLVLLGLENWDTSKVTNMNRMFCCAFLKDSNVDLSGIANWDVSNVTGMMEMFAGMGGRGETFELDLSGWDTSSVTNMEYFLAGTPKLSKLTLGSKFKFVDIDSEFSDATPYPVAPSNTLSDDSGLWYIEGTNVGINPEDVHKDATETTTYVVYPTN